MKCSRGAITVFITLIMIPTILISTLLVEMARIKLYGNQALMAADSYADAVLSQYDNVLREIYGLYGITQDNTIENGSDTYSLDKALETYREYLLSSFNPNEALIYNPNVNNAAYSGFMPYQTAVTELNYRVVPESSLGNDAVFNTQINDFMQYRIWQPVLDKGIEKIKDKFSGEADFDKEVKDFIEDTSQEVVIEAVKEMMGMKDTVTAVSNKIKIDKKVKKYYTYAGEYYGQLVLFEGVPSYLLGVKEKHNTVKEVIQEVIASGSYSVYIAYIREDSSAIQSAKDKREDIEDAEEANERAIEEAQAQEAIYAAQGIAATVTPVLVDVPTLSAEESRLLSIADAYDADPEARADRLRSKMESALNEYSDAAYKNGNVRIDNYDQMLGTLSDKTELVDGTLKEVNILKDELMGMLEGDSEDDENNQNGIDDDVKSGIVDDLGQLGKLLNEDTAAFRGIYNVLAGNKETMETFNSMVSSSISTYQSIINCYIDDSGAPEAMPTVIDPNLYNCFTCTGNPSYDSLYMTLKECFTDEIVEDKDLIKDAKNKTKVEQKNSEEDMEDTGKEDKEPKVRDIPKAFQMQDGTEVKYNSADYAEDLGNLADNMGVAGKLIDKLFLVQYDMGMFSSRITEDGNKTLTGIEMCEEINYLYQAELEYLLIGSDESKKNLNSTRNYICLFRSAMNYASTYKIKEVNGAIKAICDPVTTANPVVGVLLNQSLRLAFAALETGIDWKVLTDIDEVYGLGGTSSVVLFKTKLEELTVIKYAKDDLLEKLPSLQDAINEEFDLKKDSMALSYEQYVWAMLFVFCKAERLEQRTKNLIELNLNAIKQDIGEGKMTEKVYSLSQTYTAVDASCGVQMNFGVFPMDMFAGFANPSTYDQMADLEKQMYQFSVTKGY